jgi:ATP-dependent 26S proteasome regulatory subunit
MTAKVSPATKLERLIRSKYPVITITSAEESRVQATVRAVGDDLDKATFVWTVSGGIRRLTGEAAQSDPSPEETQDPNAALKALAGWGSREDGRRLPESVIFLFKDLHAFFNDPVVLRLIRDIALVFQERPYTLVMLSPNFNTPADLEKDIALMDWPLPENGEIERILDDCTNRLRNAKSKRTGEAIRIDVGGKTRDRILRALTGLTAFDASSALSLAAVTHNALDERAIKVILEEKRLIVRKTGYLEYFDTDVTASDIGGLKNLKSYTELKRAAFSKEAAAYGLDNPRGFLMVGVPGAGKSLSAKASTGGQMPLLRMDIGALMGGLVGQSESNVRNALRLAEAVAPCALWLDEIEKAFAGMNGSGSSDGGVGMRVLGTILTWMQERTAPVYVIATANEITNLRPELLSRFDDIFWVDLPNAAERAEIISIHLRKRRQDPARFEMAQVVTALDGYVGREIEKVVNAALNFGFYDGARDITTDDLLRAVAQIVPISRSRADDIKALRAWGKANALPASEDLAAAAEQPAGRQIEL